MKKPNLTKAIVGVLMLLNCLTLAGQEIKDELKKQNEDISDLIVSVPEEKKAKISTRIGLSTFTHIGIQYERRQRDNLGFSVEVGLQYATNLMGSGTSLFCGNESLQLFFGRLGLVSRGGIMFYPSKSRPNSISVQLDFRKLKTNNIVTEEACFSGSSSGGYSEYRLKGIEGGITSRINLMREDDSIGFYMGLGGAVRSMLKTYSIEGTRDARRESDRIEVIHGFVPRVDLGMKIRLIEMK